MFAIALKEFFSLQYGSYSISVAKSVLVHHRKVIHFSKVDSLFSGKRSLLVFHIKVCPYSPAQGPFVLILYSFNALHCNVLPCSLKKAPSSSFIAKSFFLRHYRVLLPSPPQGSSFFNFEGPSSFSIPRSFLLLHCKFPTHSLMQGPKVIPSFPLQELNAVHCSPLQGPSSFSLSISLLVIYCKVAHCSKLQSCFLLSVTRVKMCFLFTIARSFIVLHHRLLLVFCQILFFVPLHNILLILYFKVLHPSPTVRLILVLQDKVLPYSKVCYWLTVTRSLLILHPKVLLCSPLQGPSFIQIKPNQIIESI